MIDYEKRRMELIITAFLYKIETENVIFELRKIIDRLGKYSRRSKFEDELIHLQIRQKQLSAYIKRNLMVCVNRSQSFKCEIDDIRGLTEEDIKKGYILLGTGEDLTHVLFLRNGNIIPLEGNQNILKKEISTFEVFGIKSYPTSLIKRKLETEIKVV